MMGTWLREWQIKLYGWKAQRAVRRDDLLQVRHCLTQMARLMAARPDSLIRRLEKDRGLL